LKEKRMGEDEIKGVEDVGRQGGGMNKHTNSHHQILLINQNKGFLISIAS